MSSRGPGRSQGRWPPWRAEGSARTRHTRVHTCSQVWYCQVPEAGETSRVVLYLLDPACGTGLPI